MLLAALTVTAMTPHQSMEEVVQFRMGWRNATTMRPVTLPIYQLRNATTIDNRTNPFIYPVDALPKELVIKNHTAPLVTTCQEKAHAVVRTGEITWTMLPNTGNKTSQAVHRLGNWMPVPIGPQKETAIILQQQLKWQTRLFNDTADVLINVTKAIDATVCGLQVIYSRLQEERFVRVITTPNPNEWRRLFDISDASWLQIKPEQTRCNMTMCTVSWIQWNVTQVITICKFQVLPLIVHNKYMFLRTYGEWFSPQTNHTYDLKDCETTDRGQACLLSKGYRDPCFTGDTALCEWYIEPASDMLWQVGPNTLCVATTHNHTQLPTVPFSGCLKGLHLWHWHNVTYRLTNFTTESHLTAVQWKVLHLPWRISLERFQSALSRSRDLKDIMSSHSQNVTRALVTTLVNREQVLHAAKMVEMDSAHHWWDIFSGMSVTARTYVAPPLLILVAILCVLTLCNVLTCLYIRRIKQRLSRTIYHTALR
ncbi:uncharacterized protein LOC121645122 [Melanotaenia boesemani]|uniref:uncharacterized protein LOC121645122 n=1 Tax=Melanotaenia boesemani TaxID=1250792 RepID=UPI001C05C5C6|nr:uncharacterized protein LOC121645122 [Melanotaenia boesemani]XP_041849452.1 uncharacterized protein LOC121645122 [Melanotaenia boesemani]